MLLCPSFEFWLLGSVVWESTEKDLDVQGLRAATRRLWETGVFQRLCCVKTPPSGLEGGVGRPTRQLACCLQPNAPWCLVSGWGVLSLGHKWHGVTGQALSASHCSLSLPLRHQPWCSECTSDEDRAWKPPQNQHPPTCRMWPLGSETPASSLSLSPHLGNWRPQFPTQPYFTLSSQRDSGTLWPQKTCHFIRILKKESQRVIHSCFNDFVSLLTETAFSWERTAAHWYQCVHGISHNALSRHFHSQLTQFILPQSLPSYSNSPSLQSFVVQRWTIVSPDLQRMFLPN